MEKNVPKLDINKLNKNIVNDPFGLKELDFRQRVPERSEMFDENEAQTYINGCDYLESVDDLLLAWEIQQKFSHVGLGNMKIMDAMCGPGRLGRELLGLGAKHVVFHDGDQTMITYAKEKALTVVQPGQEMDAVLSLVDQMPFDDNQFDLVVCHNSTHQLSDLTKLKEAMAEFARVIKPGGHILIADYQRSSDDPEFIEALNERLKETRPEIVPLLLPTFTAAFSKKEFEEVCMAIPCIGRFLVESADFPNNLTPDMWEKVELDPVKGHALDFSPISLRVIAQKEEKI